MQDSGPQGPWLDTPGLKHAQTAGKRFDKV